MRERLKFLGVECAVVPAGHLPRQPLGEGVFLRRCAEAGQRAGPFPEGHDRAHLGFPNHVAGRVYARDHLLKPPDTIGGRRPSTHGEAGAGHPGTNGVPRAGQGPMLLNVRAAVRVFRRSSGPVSSRFGVAPRRGAGRAPLSSACFRHTRGGNLENAFRAPLLPLDVGRDPNVPGPPVAVQLSNAEVPQESPRPGLLLAMRAVAGALFQRLPTALGKSLQCEAQGVVR